ncbi:MAG: phosphoribosylamine--glycine ligase [Pirellulales bacterium]
MKVLVVGGGGREHALSWKIAQSKRVRRLFVTPGNAGTALEAENVDLADSDRPDAGIPRTVEFAQQNQIDLTVIGPEAPLAAGMVDALEEAGIRTFGPSKQAAELEASKVFCRNLLRHADIPSPDFHTFRDAASAMTFLTEREDVPVVVKADGLAAGKGVVVCDNSAQATQAIERIASDMQSGEGQFGEAGNQLVLEERLVGQEISVLALTDGQTIVTMPAAQDHKLAYDGGKGPNTGGMGAYSPTPLADDAVMRTIEEKVLVPTVHQLKRSRRPFRGVLYAGLMLTKQGVKVLEYNVRFGDPECQPLMMRLESDLVDLLEATVEGRLDRIEPLRWDPRPAVCVVMASEGYPGKYTTGHAIRGLDDASQLPHVKVFHAGTAMRDGQVVTSGGRVLGVTALGNTISAAKLQAYKAVKCIRWNGAWCRKDISDKALEPLQF